MKPLTKREELTEIRRRITAAIKDRQEVKIQSDGVIFNGNHTMHFTIRGKDYYFKGEITKRVEVQHD